MIKSMFNRSGPLPFRTMFGWGLGSFASATMYQATSVLLLHYLINDVAIAAATAGAMIGLTKIFDAIIDPLIGAWSDRTKSRWGRRRPFILAGGFLSALSFILIFTFPYPDDTTLRTLTVVLFLLLNTAGYALLSVPYLAMPAEMTTDGHSRTHLVSYRVAGLAFGQISGSVIAPYLISVGGGGSTGYSLMGVITGLIILIATYFCFQLTDKAPQTEITSDTHLSRKEKWALAFSNKPFVVLLFVKLANLCGVSWFFAMMPFLFVSYLGLTYADLGAYFLFQAPLLFISQPFWLGVSKRLGKKGLYFSSVFVYVLSTASWLFADPSDPFSYALIRAVVIGFASGGLLLAGQAMLPDAISYDFRRSGLRREGIFAGIYTTVEKASHAFAAALIGAGLSFIGYTAGRDGTPFSVESAEMLTYFMLAPGLFNIVSAIILTAYHIPDDDKSQAPKPVT